VTRLAGGHSGAVAAVRLAGARALALVGQERPVVAAGQPVGAVVVPLDREGTQLRVGCPRVPAGAVVVRDDAVGPELPSVVVAVTVSVVREAGSGKGKSGRQQPRDDPSLLHQTSWAVSLSHPQ